MPNAARGALERRSLPPLELTAQWDRLNKCLYCFAPPFFTFALDGDSPLPESWITSWSHPALAGSPGIGHLGTGTSLRSQLRAVRTGAAVTWWRGVWRARDLPVGGVLPLPLPFWVLGVVTSFYWARGGWCAVNGSDSAQPRCEGGDLTLREAKLPEWGQGAVNTWKRVQSKGGGGKCKSSQLEAV